MILVPFPQTTENTENTENEVTDDDNMGHRVTDILEPE